jgi:phosphopantothenoylcysteine synthetase/decarboxylase
VLVGFAVETGGEEALVGYAKGKLTEKSVDLVVANEASHAFGRDDDRAILVTQSGAEPLGTLPKLALADVVLDRVKSLLGPGLHGERRDGGRQ